MPASYLVVPVDKLFGAMKRRDYSKFIDPTSLEARSPEFKRLINKQSRIENASEDLISIPAEEVASIFAKRLIKLSSLFNLEKV